MKSEHVLDIPPEIPWVVQARHIGRKHDGQTARFLLDDGSDERRTLFRHFRVVPVACGEFHIVGRQTDG